MQSVAEHVPHDDQIGVLAVHSDSVHGEELREQRAAVAGDNMLEEERKWMKNGYWGMKGNNFTALARTQGLGALKNMAHKGRSSFWDSLAPQRPE